MVKKCRICGYRFKDDDEVICPECFTAREDTADCGSFSDDLHSHDLGYNDSGTQPRESDVFEEFKKHESSFIEEQREDEANDPIPDSTYAKKSAPTGQSADYSAFGGSGDSALRQEKLDALRNRINAQTGTNANFGNYGTYGRTGQYSGSNNNTARPRKNIGCIIFLVLFILMFVMPFISGIITLIASLSSHSGSENNDRDYSYEAPEVSIPDVSVPDIYSTFEESAEGTVSGYEVTARNFVRYESTAMIGSQELGDDWWEPYLNINDESCLDKEWQLIKFDLGLVNDLSDGERTIDALNIKAYPTDSIIYDENETPAVECKIIQYDEYEESGELCECYFIVPADSYVIRIAVPTVSSEKGDETVYIDVMSFEFSVNNGQPYS